MFPDKNNARGFTLLELMVTIAIVGVLAAIAIPNFIAYRNKSFCTRTETDANNIAVAVGDYFAIPSHMATPAFGDLQNGNGIRLSGDNSTANATLEGANPDINITIAVTDMSGQCPDGYQRSDPNWNNNVYTKFIRF